MQQKSGQKLQRLGESSLMSSGYVATFELRNQSRTVAVETSAKQKPSQVTGITTWDIPVKHWSYKNLQSSDAFYQLSRKAVFPPSFLVSISEIN